MGVGADWCSRCGKGVARDSPQEVRAKTDDRVDPVEDLVGQVAVAAPIWLSRCVVVRGPMIADVNGRMTGTRRRCHVDERHAGAFGKLGERIDGIELARVLRHGEVVTNRQP